MGNNTSIDLTGGSKKNSSNGQANSLFNAFGKQTDNRPPQSKEALLVLSSTALTMQIPVIILGIVMIIFFHVRLKKIPYVILQNIFVLDIFTAMVPGVIWSVAINFDHLGIAIPFLCRAVAFLQSFLYNAFLLNIALLSLSQFLLCARPALYHKVFVNVPVTRILLLLVWSVGGLMSASPLNSDGQWGRYDKFDSTCWIQWLPDNAAAMSYNIVITIVTIGPAVVFTVLAFVFTVPRKKVSNNQETNNPPPQQDVVIIAAIQLLVFIVLWIALTIMNVLWIKDWRNVDVKVHMAFLYLYFARGIWNPIVCFAVSGNVRTAFVDTMIRCRCRSMQVAPSDVHHHAAQDESKGQAQSNDSHIQHEVVTAENLQN